MTSQRRKFNIYKRIRRTWVKHWNGLLPPAVQAVFDATLLRQSTPLEIFGASRRYKSIGEMTFKFSRV